MRKLIKKITSLFFTELSKQMIGGYTPPIKVNYFSLFTKNTFLGENTHFNGINIRGKGKVFIGNNFHSGKNILIINTYHKYDLGDSIPYDSKDLISKNVTIEDNVWVGDRVIILGGVKIGEGSVIQAGAVVVNDIPKYSIAGGNPAKVFKQRDIKSYLNLKKQKKYF